ncbi:PREDICTED: fructose-1 [Prunus dulcis]|uniref:fructose-bisphosphatase n=1 Tax=Prunus dulcis TaxID=3755 RepID=A0A5E4GE57_PRUDU|nr:fructose-1,6-bisphosphatase, chloroplastic-like [Prunus dulcis]XP_034227218.1 fructose-1,6-bisphosphatase, chloroplastic-like [Prunus dulcis]VVA37900.1 PREDICTED: fructose-1 [Prunus dulcis]VVA41252.1 PREDICTED: fructose-1 [Prunus dulcis]
MPLPTTITPPFLCPAPIFPPNHPHFPPRNQFPPRPIFHRPRMATLSGFIAGSQLVGSSGSGGGGDNEARTLIEYVGGGGVDVGDDLVLLIHHLQYACKKIAALVASPFNSTLGKHTSFAAGAGGSAGGSGRDAPKPLDIVSNEIILSSLRSSGKVAVMASEEDDTPTWIRDDGPFVVVTDPLDGSRNIDASIPTGTIFGIYRRLEELDHLPTEEKALLNSLQTGTRLVASGYVLYSSATIFCTSFGSGTHAFTLDHSTGDFILTHPSLKIPSRGQIYSVNDARYFDWPDGLRLYIDTVRQGKGRYPKKYSARYICSLVADFHRTLLYGGVTMNPRDHLRLVYEANPLSFLVEQAGGKGSDGKNRILSIQPVKLHQRLPLFLGSCEDMEELESYGNVQQKVNPGYEV